MSRVHRPVRRYTPRRRDAVPTSESEARYLAWRWRQLTLAGLGRWAMLEGTPDEAEGKRLRDEVDAHAKRLESLQLVDRIPAMEAALEALGLLEGTERLSGRELPVMSTAPRAAQEGAPRGR